MKNRILEIIKRFVRYFLATPRLLTEYPLREFFFRTFVALRYIKYTEYNRDYQIYLKENRITKEDKEKAVKEITNFDKHPLLSIVMPVYNVDPKWLKKAISSIKKQWYSNWELCIADDCSTDKRLKPLLEEYDKKDTRIKVVFREKNGHISEASNTAIDLVTGEFIILMDNDDEIHPQALYKIAKVINEKPSVGLIYSDEDKMELNGTRCDPIFKSDYSPDYLLSTNYFCHLTAVKTDIVKKVGGLRKGYEGSQDYDLFLRSVEHIDDNDIVHIPDVLYSWRKIPGSTALTYDQKGYAQQTSFEALKDTIKRRDIKGVILNGIQGGFFRIKYSLLEKPLVSIVIPTLELDNNLEDCIETIFKKTEYKNYEIVVVCSGDIDSDFIKDKRIKFVKFNEEYNLQKMRNLGFENSKGSHIIFFNTDLRVKDEKWVEGLLEYSQRDKTAAVGPKIRLRNRDVVSTGYWIEGEDMIKNIHLNLPPHMQVRANLVANYTILSNLCFMISRKEFEKVKGFSTDHNDILSWLDFFIKLGEANYFSIFTPHVELVYLHDEDIRKEYKIKANGEKDFLRDLNRRLYNLKIKHF